MENELDIVTRYTASAPVDLGAIFSELGVGYREQSIPTGESGWIERDGDYFTVVVNSLDGEQRRRFTAAHELAHYLLHRDLMDDGSRMNRHTDRLFDKNGDDDDGLFNPRHEAQANKMAARIIMPAKLVRQKRAEGMSTSEIAKAFKVSRAAMEIRLSTLGLA